MALGFYADVVAQGLKFQDMADLKTAYSVGETLRFAGSLVLDMEPEDLQLLVIPQAGEEKVDLNIYDPMPGGSGPLKQMVEAWLELGRLTRTSVPIADIAAQAVHLDDS